MSMSMKDTLNNTVTVNKAITGNTKELGTHVFPVGTKQQHHHSKTLESIADHVGKECGMDMRMLVKHSRESAPSQPPDLSGQDANDLAKL